MADTFQSFPLQTTQMLLLDFECVGDSFKNQGGIQPVVNKTSFFFLPFFFLEEAWTSWPCCSRLKVLSLGLSLVLHLLFSHPALFPLLAASPTICTDLPNERMGIWRTELARGALSYQTRSLSAPGNQPRTHCFLNGLHYIDQTPWQHLTLALSLVCEKNVCFHKYLTASSCLSLSSLASLWPLSRIGTGSKAWAGKQWPLMGRLVFLHMRESVCWKRDK